jgi:hypothetical protein
MSSKKLKANALTHCEAIASPYPEVALVRSRACLWNPFMTALLRTEIQRPHRYIEEQTSHSCFQRSAGRLVDEMRACKLRACGYRVCCPVVAGAIVPEHSPNPILGSPGFWQ